MKVRDIKDEISVFGFEGINEKNDSLVLSFFCVIISDNDSFFKNI